MTTLLLVVAVALLIGAMVLVTVGSLRSRRDAEAAGLPGSTYVVLGCALAALALLPVGLLIVTRAG